MDSVTYMTVDDKVKDYMTNLHAVYRSLLLLKLGVKEEHLLRVSSMPFTIKLEDSGNDEASITLTQVFQGKSQNVKVNIFPSLDNDSGIQGKAGKQFSNEIVNLMYSAVEFGDDVKSIMYVKGGQVLTITRDEGITHQYDINELFHKRRRA